MRTNGRPVDELLVQADLACFRLDDPDQPIPLLSMISFVRTASWVEGPDFPSRVVSSSSVRDLGMIGGVALSADNVRGAIAGVTEALSHHVTHDMITIRPVPGGVIVRECWGMRSDDETRHIVQQYVAALIQALCASSGATRPLFEYVALVPHPVHGVAHLRQWFGEHVVASRDGALELSISARVADRPLRLNEPSRPIRRPRSGPPLPRGQGSLIPSSKIVVAEMLSNGAPTVESLAAAAGLSVRTLQRRLAEEGTTFSRLLEGVRREHAISHLAGGDTAAREIAAALGYERQSSLTRAVRRWTGVTPRSMRRHGKT
jgi:AraC-like DNA-binding protein